MLSWLESLALGGTGGPATIKVVPGTPMTVAPGCQVSPCFVCTLRSTIEEALLRHPGYKVELRRRIEEREKKLQQARERQQKKMKARKGKGAPPLPPPPPLEEPKIPDPLELHIVGLRRENSVSDTFDDRMVDFCRLPTGAEAGKIKEAAESLLAPLEAAAKEVPASVRTISCSGAPWLVGLFTISTDPGLKTTLAEIDQKIEAARQKADRSKSARDKKRLEVAEAQKIKLTDQNVLLEEGWEQEDRGMMLPGYFPNAYTYRIHHGSGKHFASDTSLTALTTGGVPALRMFSVRHVRRNPRKFLASRRRVQELKSESGSRAFETLEAFLVVRQEPPAKGDDEKGKKGKKRKVAPRMWIAEVQVPSNKETIALQDDDVLLLRGTAGGTNIHRAHNVSLPAGAKRLKGGASSAKVSTWSEGCQVFPDWQSFNFFITLCAVAKRWKCASEYHVGPDKPECAILEASEGDALGSGEQALVAAFGQNFIDGCADVNRLARERKGKESAPVQQTRRTIDELTWTNENQKELSGLEELESDLKDEGKTLDKATALMLKPLRAKRSHRRTPEEEEKLKNAYKTRDSWRREYLREKTTRLAADHLRICDLKWACKAHFSYVLVEMNSDEIAIVEKSFTNGVNKEWNGKLV